jgi:hypothetical protein
LSASTIAACQTWWVNAGTASSHSLNASNRLLGRDFGFPIPLLPWLPSSWSARVMAARNNWPHELRDIVAAAGFGLLKIDYVLPVLELYRWMPASAISAYRRLVPPIERDPLCGNSAFRAWWWQPGSVSDRIPPCRATISTVKVSEASPTETLFRGAKPSRIGFRRNFRKARLSSPNRQREYGTTAGDLPSERKGFASGVIGLARRGIAP